MIRHASAQPHAVGALPIAMVQPPLVAALVPHSRSPCADNAGSGAANAPAVRLASVLLAAHEEQRAASAAGEHHESVVHVRGSVVHRLSTSADKSPVSPRPPAALWPRCLPHHAATATVKEFGEEIWGWPFFTRFTRFLNPIYTWCISQRLARCLLKRGFDESTSFVGFVERVLRQAACALDEQMDLELGAQRQSPVRVSLDKPVFYLDAENGALKGTDGRVVTLDERVVRVLLALAGEIPGQGRRQPLGKLSDGAVASLYSGTRREWAPEEAAKITYQFTRVLRRSLSRADVRDRDAIVKRLREKGVAMGTRWARPAVRGKSEVGLFLGRRRDIAAADE